MNDIHDIRPLIDISYFSWQILLLVFVIIVLVVALFWRVIKAYWLAYRAKKNGEKTAQPVKPRIDILKEAQKKLKEAQYLLKKEQIEESLLVASHACKLYLEGTYHFRATGMTAYDIIATDHLPKGKKEVFKKIFERLNVENFSAQDITKEEAQETLLMIKKQLQ